jgi:hypothetical protein
MHVLVDDVLPGLDRPRLDRPLDADPLHLIEAEPMDPSPASRPPVLRGEHLWFVVGNVLALIHVVDEVVFTGQPITPPAILAVVGIVGYVFLPLLARSILALGLGAAWVFTSVRNHVIPMLTHGPMASDADYTAVFAVAGGLILLALGASLLRARKRGRTPGLAA